MVPKAVRLFALMHAAAVPRSVCQDCVKLTHMMQACFEEPQRGPLTGVFVEPFLMLKGSFMLEYFAAKGPKYAKK